MGSPRPPDLASFLGRLSGALRDRDIDFMLIGGQAVLLHGRPRLTEVVDVTLAMGPDGLPTVLEAAEIPGREDLPGRLADLRRS